MKQVVGRRRLILELPSLFSNQEELLSAPPTAERTKRQVFASVFIGSARYRMDLPDTKKRQKALQSQFKEEELIEAVGRVHPDERFSEFVWCPVVQECVLKSSMVAGHLFPAVATQVTMDAIFGPQEQFIWRNQTATSQPGVRGELFRARNGISSPIVPKLKPERGRSLRSRNIRCESCGQMSPPCERR